MKTTVFPLFTTLLFQLMLLLLCHSETVQAEEEKYTVASVNVSQAHVGETIALRCDVTNASVWGFRRNIIYFKLANIEDDVALYFIKSTEHGSENVTFDPNPGGVIFKVIPLGNISRTSYQVGIVANQSFSSQFYCTMCNDHICTSYSHGVNISVIPKKEVEPTLAPKLISSVGSVPLGHPFTLTCSLSNAFSPQNKSYLVVFYNSRDALLARYEVDASGGAFLFSKEYPSVSVHRGNQSTFPNFDLAVTERVDPQLSYRCSLWTYTPFQISNSNRWKPEEAPSVNFTSVVNGREHQGRCLVENFAHHTDLDYQIQFFTDLGPKESNLLGTYLIQSNRVIEFDVQTVSHWDLILNGAQKTYPTFEILATVSEGVKVANHSWWCELSYTEPGQGNFIQLITSTHLSL